MKVVVIALGIAALSGIQVTAFPRLQSMNLQPLTKHSKRAGNCPYAEINKPEKRQANFDPSTQYVSTTGSHAFVAPNFAAGDQRGPCPGCE